MNPEPQQFSLEVVGDYIHMNTWGKLDIKNVDEPANAALQLAQEKNIRKLLDNISDVDSSGANIAVQTKGIGVIWKLRAFDKIAIVLGQSHLRSLFFDTLDTLHLDGTIKFRGFDNEDDAVAWLKES